MRNQNKERKSDYIKNTSGTQSVIETQKVRVKDNNRININWRKKYNKWILKRANQTPKYLWIVCVGRKKLIKSFFAAIVVSVFVLCKNKCSAAMWEKNPTTSFIE